ncbi:MAG: tRNA epoxyqueuosine(34) reductase QueG [Bacteroidota bacterium]|nr:tRNA epoxyqueuosine(34) reductase QueG [Bacteroidota bacterium]
MLNRNKHTTIVKQQANRLGFDYCGVSKAEFLEEEAPRLEKWLKLKMQGEMHYMENHFDKRLDPRLLVEGSKCVISLLLNYFPSQTQNPTAPQISKYAYGNDYHDVIKSKCKELVEILKAEIGDFNGRCFVDSAPVMDKAWASKSGLGWVGKNANLINKKSGSFFFIAEIICDLDLEFDSPIKDYCGSCTMCMDACPTQAIVAPYTVDGSKCISYLTIELKNSIPNEFKEKMDDWVFGCDICQDVCPWNRFSKPHSEPLFENKTGLLDWSRNEWQEITEETFKKVFSKSAVKRTKFSGLERNLRFLR